MIIVSLLLLSTFIGSVFAAPMIQQLYVANFPSSQRVTVSNFPKAQNVTVTNPFTTSITVQVPVIQKTVRVVDNLNITLPPCPACDPADGTFIATSPADSSLGFRQATIYLHWDSISPGLGNAGLWFVAAQKPSTEFPGYSCALQSGGNCLQEILYPQRQGGQGTFSMIVNVVGEQFAFYLTSGSTQDQRFTNLSIAVFLSN